MVLDYFDKVSNVHEPLHPDTQKKLRELILMYVEQGKKETFKYIKKNLRGKKATY